MTVAELLNRINAREFIEWMAYYSIEPFGEWRADLRAGIISATVASVHRAEGTEQYIPKDFMIDFWKETAKEPEGRILIGEVEKLRMSLCRPRVVLLSEKMEELRKRLRR